MARVLLGLLLAAIVTLMLPVAQWRTGRLDVVALSLEPGDHFGEPVRRVWIDTDAACGAGRLTDPDDCFAILLLTHAPDIRVAGISTVFGNAALDVTDRTTRQLVDVLSASGRPMAAVHSGSAEPLPSGQAADRPAHRALRDALAQGPLAIVALGPLSNVAAVLRESPELRRNITRIIAVMGRRPGHLFHPAEGAHGAMLFGHGPVFSDLNFVSDPLAAAQVVRMNVPLVLVPYDAARHIELTRADLERMRARGDGPAWVAERAFGWLEHWRDDIGRDGFYPFDAMAAVFALRPDLLRCATVPIRAGEDQRFFGPFEQAPALLAGPDAAENVPPDASLATGSALYCPDVAGALRDWLSAQLGGARP